MGDWDQSPGGALLGAWKKLAGVTVNSAWYDSDSLERPKCLERTRKKLLDYIYRLLDNPEKSLFVWLHGMAGVGKSAVAFTIAERMRGQTVRENVPDENRLAGTFFFSRKNKDRCTTGCFFATLAYQLARNFPSIRDDVSKAICDDPTLLDSDMFGDIQMTALFLRPLRELRSRLLEGRPLVFVIDALDECEDIHETTRLISLLGQALRDPRLPVIHVLFTSRSEVHIHEAFDKEAVRPLVQKIPTDIPGEDITSLVSLDGADVDGDICIFLQHSLKELQRHHPDFLRPTEEELQRLTRRAGRRLL